MTITVSPADSSSGAVKVVAPPLGVVVGEIVPQEEVAHDADHVTPLLDGSLVTVAINLVEAPASSVVVTGLMATSILDVAAELPPQPATMTVATVQSSPNAMILRITRLLSTRRSDLRARLALQTCVLRSHRTL